jgi:cytochrome P450
MLDKGHPADLIADFAMPLPCDVICSLLGAPESDYPRILDWSRRMNSNATTEEEARQLIKEFCDEYLADRVKLKDSSPGDDLLSRLAVNQLRTGKLTLHKIVALARVFLTAGHETTTGTIGLGMAALLTHPEQLSKLKADPSRIGNAVEEILRYSTAPHIGRLRVATEDFEMADVRIAKGDALIMSTTSADRDPAFIDRPHEFDLTRDPKDYLVFGTGIHMCLGQPLARLELQIAVGALVGRIPTMKLASPVSELKFNANSPVYGLEALPVVW